MLARLLQMIFVPNATRRKLAARDTAGARARRPAPAAGRTAPSADRDSVLDEAMAVYRRQREVYESLDEETRRQIDADAAKLFGDAIKAKR